MLPTWYNEYKDLIEKSINSYLDEYLNKIVSKPLEDFKNVIKYSVKGGKKVRAILALEFYLLLTGKNIYDIKESDDIMKFCISLEFMHAYSLIHDDMPVMDNDEFRRGNPTVWKKYGESDAMLVGDLLNTISFEVLSDIVNPTNALMLIKLLSSSTGYYGMLGGQVEDLYFEENSEELDLSKLKSMHSKKTGALIKASILGGVLLSENLENFDNHSKYSDNIGLAFQIKDDILDVEGTKEKTGKSIGGEQKGFVHFLGLEKSKKELNNLITDSVTLISNLNSEKLNFLTNYIGERKG